MKRLYWFAGLSLLVHSLGLSRDKFASYRPYPYLFLHGRTASASQWGMECSDGKTIPGITDAQRHAQRIVHPDHPTLPELQDLPTCKLLNQFWVKKGYAEALYEEFFRPHECNQTYRTKDGIVQSPTLEGEAPSIRYTNVPRFPPALCNDNNFYEDFEQAFPNKPVGPDFKWLPADELPNPSWGPVYDQVKSEPWDRMSFNHSYIEAYQGDGSAKDRPKQDREYLDDSWTEIAPDFKSYYGPDDPKTLVEIGRQRLKQVLDEYYQDENNNPNWACDSSKKAIIVAYSTGTSVAGGIIYHDQDILKEKGKEIFTWCKDGVPTSPENAVKARELLSSHIASVVAHNPVVAGSHFAPGEEDGKFIILTGVPVWLPALTYAGIRSPIFGKNPIFSSGIQAGNAMAAAIGGGGGIGATVAGWTAATMILNAVQMSKSQDLLASDLAWHSDYFKRLRGYGLPPADVLTTYAPDLTINPIEKMSRIPYKTVATHTFGMEAYIDWTLMGTATVLTLSGFTSGQWDVAAAGGVAILGLIQWIRWNQGTDIVLSPDEENTSGKALNGNALIEHTVVPNFAHTDLLMPGSYPYQSKVWDPLRKYMVGKPEVSREVLVRNKCVGHVGEFNRGCDAFSPGGTRVDPNAALPIDFYDVMSKWTTRDDNGNIVSQASTVDYSNKDPNDVLKITDGGGSPLSFELYYKSQLMATDKVSSYINGKYTPLKFRQDYGSTTDGKTHSAFVRIPLTFTDDGKYGLPSKWSNLVSGLQNGGNIVGFSAENPAGKVIEKRLIYFDKLGMIVSRPDYLQNGFGSPTWNNYKSLNLSVLNYQSGLGNPNIPEATSKGILFAFQTDLKPKSVKVSVYKTDAEGERDQVTLPRIYNMDAASAPGGSGAPIYDPKSASVSSGKVYLSRRPVDELGARDPTCTDPNLCRDPHQFFFWVSPNDLTFNDKGELEGVKHLAVEVEKYPPIGSTDQGNKTYYNLEFTIDNTVPGPIKVFSPALVKTIGAHSYGDEDEDGTLDKESSVVCKTDELCPLGLDGVDNNANGKTDEIEEVREIKKYSQNLNINGERISQGIHFRVQVDDNMQKVQPFANSLQWGIKGPSGEDVFTSDLKRHMFGTIFTDYFPLPSIGQKRLPDGLYSVWVKVSDLAGNVLDQTVTQFIMDNTPPDLKVFGSVADNWTSDASLKPLSLYKADSYAATQVTSNEQADVWIKLIPKYGVGGQFVVQGKIYPSLNATTHQLNPIPLRLFDSFEFLKLTGVESAGKKFFEKLPDGLYKIEVIAFDEVGNVSQPYPALGTGNDFTFRVDRTPPQVSALSVTPFFALNSADPILHIDVSQGLDDADNKTSALQYSLAFDGTAVQTAQAGAFAGDDYINHLGFGPLVNPTLFTPGSHNLTLSVSEKDANGIRNTTAATATFIYKNWDIRISQPEKSRRVGGKIQILGMVGDPDVEDKSLFKNFTLSYVEGQYEGHPQDLPATRKVAGMVAMGSANNVGGFESTGLDALGVWDTRQATTGVQAYTLILEAFQEDGKSVKALRDITVDNSTTTPPSGMALTYDAVVENGRTLENNYTYSGPPAKIALSIFDGAQKLVNRKEVITAPLTFDESYFPPKDKCVIGVSGENFRIRMTPGDKNSFAFMLKGFVSDDAAFTFKYYDKDHVELTAPVPENVIQIENGGLIYSPEFSMLPPGAVTADFSIGVLQLDAAPVIQFGNSVFDMRFPEKASSAPIPPGDIQIGAGKVSPLGNPFVYSLEPFVRWNLDNRLGEEVGKGDYTLKLEAMGLNGIDYVASVPSERLYHKTTDPRIGIANAVVGGDVIVPLISGDKISVSVPLQFSISHAGFVSVMLFKKGNPTPIRQIADRVLMTGGLDKVISVFGWNEEYGSGGLSLAEGEEYYFQIKAEAQVGSSVCTVSPDDGACYLNRDAVPMNLDFTIGKAAQSQVWKAGETPPVILKSLNPATARPEVLAPVSPVKWKISDVQGKYYPPLHVDYTVEAQGKSQGLQIGYENMTVTPDPKSEWNYVASWYNTFQRDQGDFTRSRSLLVKTDWDAETKVRFMGPTIWAHDPGCSSYDDSQPWSNCNQGEGNAADSGPFALIGNSSSPQYHIWNGLYFREHPVSVNGVSYNFLPPAGCPGGNGGGCVDAMGWGLMFDGGTNDVFYRMGHWNTVVNGNTYDQFGLTWNWDHSFSMNELLYLNMTKKRASLAAIIPDDLPVGSQPPLLPDVDKKVVLPGARVSLDHKRFLNEDQIFGLFTFAPSDPNKTYRFISGGGEDTYANSLDALSWVRNVGNPAYCNTSGEVCGSAFWNWGGDPSWSSYPAYMAPSVDAFDIDVTFTVKAGGAAPIQVPYHQKIEHSTNTFPFLGDGTTPPNGEVEAASGRTTVFTAFAGCNGHIEFHLLWTAPDQPYSMSYKWVPELFSSCGEQIVKASVTRSLDLNVSPKEVTPNPLTGATAKIPGYGIYAKLNSTLDAELEENLDAVVQGFYAAGGPLANLTPEPYSDTHKPFKITFNAISPKGSASDVDVSWDRSGTHDYALFRIVGPKVDPLADSWPGAFDWGRFTTNEFADPVAFEMWKNAEVTESYCQTNSDCVPQPSTPATKPYHLYHRIGTQWIRNTNIRLESMHLKLLNARDEDNLDVLVNNSDYWGPASVSGYDLKAAYLSEGLLPIQIVVKPGVASPQRFISEVESDPSARDKSSSIATYYAKDAALNSIRANAVVPGTLDAKIFDLADNSGSITHVARYGGAGGHVDLKGYQIGQEIDLSTASNAVFSAHKRVTVQFQQEAAAGKVVADVVPVDLNKLAARLDGTKLPSFDRVLAPGFILYPEIQTHAYGSEPTVTYYLKRSEVENASNPGGAISPSNLSKLYSLNPTTGELTDITAFITLEKSLTDRSALTPKACMEIAANHSPALTNPDAPDPIRNPNGINCSTGFTAADLASLDWDYVKLTAQPRYSPPAAVSGFQALSLGESAPAAPAAPAEPEFHNYVYIPIMNGGASDIYADIGTGIETSRSDIPLPGKLTSLTEPSKDFSAYKVAYGSFPADAPLTYQQLKDRGLLTIVNSDAAGAFSLAISNLQAGKNVVLARVLDGAGDEIPGLEKSEITFVASIDDFQLRESALYSNIESPDVSFSGKSSVSGTMIIRIYDDHGSEIHDISQGIVANTWTSVDWNPKLDPQVKSDQSLTFAAQVTGKTGALSPIINGTIRIDYGAPAVEVHHVQFFAGVVDIAGKCLDAFNNQPLKKCELSVLNKFGDPAIVPAITPDLAGEFRAQIKVEDFKLLIEPQSRFFVVVDGTDKAGNESSVKTDQTFIYNPDLSEKIIPLGVIRDSKVLPVEKLDGYRPWNEDLTSDGNTLVTGAQSYLSGLGGQAKSDGGWSWMLYDLQSETRRLKQEGVPLRLTGFGGTRDAGGSVNMYIKTSNSSLEPTEAEWTGTTGSVVTRWSALNVANQAVNVALGPERWLWLGIRSSVTGNENHGVFGDLNLHFAPRPSHMLGDLMAWYTLKGGTDDVRDLSGYGIPLDLEVSGGRRVYWPDDGGLKFDGTDHNGILKNLTPNPKLLAGSAGTNELTLEMWISTPNLTQMGTRLMTYGAADGSDNKNWLLAQNGKNLQFQLRTSKGASKILTTASNPLSFADGLYHIVATYKPYDAFTTAGGMRIYVNGDLAASNTEDGLLPFSGTNAWSSAYIFGIGNNPGLLDMDWEGRLFQAAVYRRALSEKDIAADYAAGSSANSPYSRFVLGVADPDRFLPEEIVGASDGDWVDDASSDGNTIRMGGVDYHSGIGGRVDAGNFAWMTYNLDLLPPGSVPMRITGFSGKQDGISGGVRTFVKLSSSPDKPLDHEWIADVPGVVNPVFDSYFGTNLPIEAPLQASKWIWVGMNGDGVEPLHAGDYGDLALITRDATAVDPNFPPLTGLNYTYYEGTWDLLPDFSALTAVKKGHVANFDITPRNRDEGFGFAFDGGIVIKTPGTYTFYVTSDDGSKLLINDRLVVDNDGPHTMKEKSGSIDLAAGIYNIKVNFFERTGAQGLLVQYSGPGIAKGPIADGDLILGSPYDAFPNQFPTDITLSSTQVKEEQPAGTAVGTFSSADPDSHDFTYSLVTGQGDADNRLFEIRGDQLFTTAPLSVAMTPTPSIRVQTKDGAGGTFEKSFALTVLDVSPVNQYKDWLHSAKIQINTTVSGANVRSDTKNFPMLVKLDASTFDFTQAMANGEDVRFMTESDFPLPYEIEKWKNGEAAIWVLVDVPGNAISNIVMYWGKAGSVSESKPSAVFGDFNGYNAVWHMNETGNTTAGGYRDATSLALHGTGVGMTSASTVLGVSGNAQSFNGTSQYIKVSGSASGPLNFPEDGTYTVSAWVKSDVLDNLQRNIVSKGDNQYGLMINSGNAWEFNESNSGAWEATTQPAEKGKWDLVVGVRNGVNQTLYVNGAVVDQTITAKTGSTRNTAFDLNIGRNSQVTTRFFDGLVDEVRISKDARSSDWIRLNYENQKSDQTLVTVAPENYSDWSHAQYLGLNTSASGADVAGAVENFPVLVRLRPDNFNFSQAQSNGRDLRFSLLSGRPLQYEIERWDAVNNVAEVWVLVPKINGNDASQRIRMHWGNPAAKNRSNPKGVFRTTDGYATVWHLGNDPTGEGQAKFLDATSRANNGRSYGGMTISNRIEGRVGYGLKLDGNGNHLHHALALNKPEGTISTWMRPDQIRQMASYYESDGTSSSYNGFGTGLPGGGLETDLGIKDGKWNYTYEDGANVTDQSGTPAVGRWDYVVFKWDRAGSATLYINGAPAVTKTLSATSFASKTPTEFNIGEVGDATLDRYWKGGLDEMRVLDRGVSDDWVALSYENQQDNQTLVEFREDYTKWSRSEQIVLNTTSTGANITSDITDFPMLVRLNSTNFSFSDAKTGGTDLRFLDQDGVALPYAIERWDATNKLAEVWVKMDRIIGNSSGQTITMLWGNAAAPDGRNPTAVFTSAAKFAGVWHMGEIPVGTNSVIDQSGNGRHGTPGGSVAAASQVDAKIGKGIYFDGSADYVRVSGQMGKPSSITLSGWAKLDQSDANGSEFLSLGDCVGLRLDDNAKNGLTGFYRNSSGGWNNTVYSFMYQGQGFHHFAYVIDGGKKQELYVDGVKKASNTFTDAITYSGLGTDTYMGTHGNGKASYDFKGILDEMRVSSEARSANWIKLNFENQRQSQTLLQFRN